MLVTNKVYFICLTALITALHILSEYLQGGVVTHYPLADASNPPISNWWGLITLPVLSWLVLEAKQRTSVHRPKSNPPVAGIPLQRTYLVGGLVFGLTMGVLWELGREDILQYFILLPWLAAPLVRIYLPETTLGFVLGMMYTFGGVLPIAFALVIQTIGYIIYIVLNRGGKWLVARVK